MDQSWGGNVFAYGGGGKFVCCINYPREWRPDLTATVRWSTSSSDSEGPDDVYWHEQIVPIERYDQLRSLNVNFLPDNKVRLIISPGSPGFPGYRGPAAPVKPIGWPKLIIKEGLK